MEQSSHLVCSLFAGDSNCAGGACVGMFQQCGGHGFDISVPCCNATASCVVKVSLSRDYHGVPIVCMHTWTDRVQACMQRRATKDMPVHVQPSLAYASQMC